MSQLKVNTIRHTGASSDAITLASDGTATAKITNNLSNKNLVINGAMQVNQRGTTSTTDFGIKVVDRFNGNATNWDERPTQAWVDVASGTTPYNLGFRKAFKWTNGNQTSGAGGSDVVSIEYKSESQDIATSGWNYKSATEFLTISFWVKSSVAQEFLCQLYNADTDETYIFVYTVSSADTWQKITHSVKGDSSLNFNNDNGQGLEMMWYLFVGTDQTIASPSLETWATYSGTDTKKDMTSTWYTTNDATFELTGVQWEVGDTATDFEHRSYADELNRCLRYYQQYPKAGDAYGPLFNCANQTSTTTQGVFSFPEMRVKPSMDDSGNFRVLFNDGALGVTGLSYINIQKSTAIIRATVSSGLSAETASNVTVNNDATAKITLSSEL